MDDYNGLASFSLGAKRGRPKKLSELEIKEQERQKKPNTHNSKSVLLYSSLKDYREKVYSQKIAQMISSLPLLIRFSEKIKKTNLKNILEEAVKRLMMSEIELAAFYLVLDSAIWADTEQNLEVIILACGFKTLNLLEAKKKFTRRNISRV